MSRLFSRSLAILLLIAVASADASAQSAGWSRINKRFAMAVAFNPLSNGRTFYATEFPDSLIRTDDYGQTWSGRRINGAGLIHQVFCLEADTSVLFVVDAANTFRSSDGGRTWATVLDTGAADGETLDYHAETNTLYFGNSLGGAIFLSRDHGVTWTRQGGAHSGMFLCTVAVSPTTAHTILTGAGNGAIGRSTDDGLSWTTPFPPAPPPTIAEIPKIIYATHAPNVAYATVYNSTANGLLRTTDDGRTWQRMPADTVHPWALEIDQRASTIVGGIPQHLWIGLQTPNFSLKELTFSQIQESWDGGLTWRKTFIDSLYSVEVMKLDTTTNVLLAATDRGLYKVQPTSGVAERIAGTDALRIAYDPKDASATIRWNAEARVHSIEFVNAAGQTRTMRVAPGQQMLRITPHEWTAGIWLVRAIADDGRVMVGKMEVK